MAHFIQTGRDLNQFKGVETHEQNTKLTKKIKIENSSKIKMSEADGGHCCRAHVERLSPDVTDPSVWQLHRETTW
jgi:hypothetical protein